MYSAMYNAPGLKPETHMDGKLSAIIISHVVIYFDFSPSSESHTAELFIDTIQCLLKCKYCKSTYFI